MTTVLASCGLSTELAWGLCQTAVCCLVLIGLLHKLENPYED